MSLIYHFNTFDMALLQHYLKIYSDLQEIASYQHKIVDGFVLGNSTPKIVQEQ